MVSRKADPAGGSDPALLAGAGSLFRLTALETVRARILLSIEHGLLSPGSRLPSLERIAEGLEVSTASARRALESLTEDGVLVRRPGRGGGTFVADARLEVKDSAVSAYRADAQVIQRLIDQRSLMETAIVHAAAQQATPDRCVELELLIEQSQQATDWMEHHVPDTRFHRLIAEMSGLPEVPTYLMTYDALIRYFVPYPMEKLEDGRDDHRELVAAFRGRDSTAAVEVTRRHIDALRHEMFPALPRADCGEGRGADTAW